jgi:hypothetical protein
LETTVTSAGFFVVVTSWVVEGFGEGAIDSLLVVVVEDGTVVPAKVIVLDKVADVETTSVEVKICVCNVVDIVEFWAGAGDPQAVSPRIRQSVIKRMKEYLIRFFIPVINKTLMRRNRNICPDVNSHWFEYQSLYIGFNQLMFHVIMIERNNHIII